HEWAPSPHPDHRRISEILSPMKCGSGAPSRKQPASARSDDAGFRGKLRLSLPGDAVREPKRRGTNALGRCSLPMNRDLDQKAVALRERRIDEALKETFPASDVPSFVGAGAPASNEPVG